MQRWLSAGCLRTASSYRFIGLDRLANDDEISETIVNAGAQPVAIKKDAVFFDSAMSFGIVRRGHIDITLLGGMGTTLVVER